MVVDAVPHVSIEIRDTAGRQLVTAIEILAPTNKRGEGRIEYLSKRRGILVSTAHLLEIDYTQPPDVPLEGEAARVAEGLLHAAGLRSS